MIVINFITSKAAPKHKLLFNKSGSAGLINYLAYCFLLLLNGVFLLINGVRVTKLDLRRTNFVAMTATNFLTSKAAAKLKLLFNISGGCIFSRVRPFHE
jgi:hypothetical protein